MWVTCLANSENRFDGSTPQVKVVVIGAIDRTEFGVGKAFPTAVVPKLVYIEMSLVFDLKV